MYIEDYIKDILAKNGISIKEAAEVLGYAEQSLRNKFTRHSISLHDLVMISCLTGSKLGIFKDGWIEVSKGIEPEFVFEPREFLSIKDFERLTEFRNKRENRIDFPMWVEKLMPGLFSTTGKTLEDIQRVCDAKRSEGSIIISSANFKQDIEICGKNHIEAAKWLTEKNLNVSANDEALNLMACAKFYDVFICCVN